MRQRLEHHQLSIHSGPQVCPGQDDRPCSSDSNFLRLRNLLARGDFFRSTSHSSSSANSLSKLVADGGEPRETSSYTRESTWRMLSELVWNRRASKRTGTRN